jgi:hypothetical protein
MQAAISTASTIHLAFAAHAACRANFARRADELSKPKTVILED